MLVAWCLDVDDNQVCTLQTGPDTRHRRTLPPGGPILFRSPPSQSEQQLCLWKCLPKRKACSLSDLVTLPSNQTKHGQQSSAGSKVCCDDRIQFSLPTSLRGSAFLPLSTQPSPGTRTTTDFQDSPSLYVRSPGPLCRPPASRFWEHPGSKSKARQLRVLPMDPTLSSDSPLYHEVSTLPRQKDTVPSKRKRV